MLSTPVHSLLKQAINKSPSHFDPFYSPPSETFGSQVWTRIRKPSASSIALSCKGFVDQHSSVSQHHCINDHFSGSFSSSVVLSHRRFVYQRSPVTLYHFINGHLFGSFPSSVILSLWHFLYEYSPLALWRCIKKSPCWLVTLVYHSMIPTFLIGESLPRADNSNKTHTETSNQGRAQHFWIKEATAYVLFAPSVPHAVTPNQRAICYFSVTLSTFTFPVGP